MRDHRGTGVKRRDATETRFVTFDRDCREPARGKRSERVDGPRTTIVEFAQ